METIECETPLAKITPELIKPESVNSWLVEEIANYGATVLLERLNETDRLLLRNVLELLADTWNTENMTERGRELAALRASLTLKHLQTGEPFDPAEIERLGEWSYLYPVNAAFILGSK
ncbi:MAG TPA: hypothetical protein VGK00_06155 [Anaerolineales bacterium]